MSYILDNIFNQINLRNIVKVCSYAYEIYSNNLCVFLKQIIRFQTKLLLK